MHTNCIAVIAILLLACGLRFGAGVWWQQRLSPDEPFYFGDSYSYWELAGGIAEGRPYSYANSRVFRAPGYPILLSVLFHVRNPPPFVWARYLGAVLGTAAVGGVMGLSYCLFGTRTAVVAGGLSAVYPGAIGMSVFILSEAPFCPFMLLQLVCWVAASRAQRKRARYGLATLGGCAAGLANLIRPSWLLFTPVAAGCALLWGRSERRQLAIAGVMLLATAVTMSPWWIRNQQAVGRFVPTTLEIGASLYDGLNPRATGGSDMYFDETFRAQVLADKSPTGGEAYEVRLDRVMRDAAIAWARDHPGRVIELAGIKFLRMWSPWPNASELQGGLFRLLTSASYVPLLLLGFLGAYRFRQRGFEIWLCLLPAIYFTGLHVIFVSSIRYRQPAMLPWIVLAAGALLTLSWGQPTARSPSAESSVESID